MASNNNYYDKIISTTNALINDKKYQEAFNILSDELKMPYIPLSYEKQFQTLLDSINIEVNDKKALKTFSIDQVLEMLYSKDENDQIVGLELIKSHNLRPIIGELKNRIQTFDKKTKQAILFEVLAEQEIDTLIVIDNISLNPIKDSIANNLEVKRAFNLIENKSGITPQITEAAHGEIYRYILLTFPKKVVNGKKLGNDILQVVKKIITGDQVLTDDQEAIFKLLSGQ